MCVPVRLRRCSATVCMLALFLMSAQPGLGQESEKLLAEVRAAWEKREKAAHYLSAKWRQEELMPKGGISRRLPMLAAKETLPAQDTKVYGRGELYFSGPDCRLQMDHPIWNAQSKEFCSAPYDAALRGGVLKSRSAPQGSPNQTGRISKDEWSNWGAGSVWPLSTSYRGITSTTFNANIGNFTAARRVQLATGPGVELTRERTETRGHARLFVDPVRNHFPTRYESFGVDGKLNVAFAIQTRQDDRFGWVLESWAISSFTDAHLTKSVTCRLDELVLGEPVPAETFDIDYSPGTFVRDDSGNMPRDLLTREGKEPREILPGERGAAYARLVESEAGELLPGGRESVFARYWWVLAGAVALVGTVLVVRRIRRTHSVSSTQ